MYPRRSDCSRMRGIGNAGLAITEAGVLKREEEMGRQTLLF